MKALLIAAGLLSLAACDQPAPLTPQANASTEAPPDVLTALKAKEAEHLTKSGGAVVRTGTTLSLKANGATIATLTDTDGTSWLYSGGFAGAEAAGEPKHYDIFRLVEEHDSTQHSLIVSDKGDPIAWVGDEVRLYTGPLIASGSIASDGSDQGTLSIEDWTTTTHTKALFDEACTPDAWVSATELKVICYSVQDDKDRSETVRMVSGTLWKFDPNGATASTEKSRPFSAEQRQYAEKAGFKRVK